MSRQFAPSPTRFFCPPPSRPLQMWRYVLSGTWKARVWDWHPKCFLVRLDETWRAVTTCCYPECSVREGAVGHDMRHAGTSEQGTGGAKRWHQCGSPRDCDLCIFAIRQSALASWVRLPWLCAAAPLTGEEFDIRSRSPELNRQIKIKE